MKRCRSSLRLVGLVGAVLVGAAGATTLATPAAADAPIISGSATCMSATGDWRVTWTVQNSETAWTGEIKAIELEPAATGIGAITVGAVLPKKGTGVLTGDQLVPGTASAATLRLTVFWDKQPPEADVTNTGAGTVRFEGTCARVASVPHVTSIIGCDGKVTVTLTNGPNATADAVFTVTTTNGFSQTVTVHPDEQVEVVFQGAPNVQQRITVAEGTVQRTLLFGDTSAPNACGELPLTGAHVASAIAAGFGLLSIGAVLFVAARRRRLRFVA